MSLKRSRILKARRSSSGKNVSGEPYLDGSFSGLFAVSRNEFQAAYTPVTCRKIMPRRSVRLKVFTLNWKTPS